MVYEIKEFKKGETIPEGSKFIRTYENSLGYFRKWVGSDVGFIFTTDRYRTYEEYEIIYVYEVPVEVE